MNENELGNGVSGIGPMIFNPEMNMRFTHEKCTTVNNTNTDKSQKQLDREKIVLEHIKRRVQEIKNSGTNGGFDNEFVDKKLRGVEKTIAAFECCMEDGLEALATPLGMLLTLLLTNIKTLPRMIEAMDEVMAQMVIERISDIINNTGSKEENE